MKVGVSWHGRIKERDALTATSLSTGDNKDEEPGRGGQRTEGDRKRDFQNEWESFCRMRSE